MSSLCVDSGHSVCVTSSIDWSQTPRRTTGVCLLSISSETPGSWLSASSCPKGSRDCLSPPVWNLRVVIWFYFTVSCSVCWLVFWLFFVVFCFLFLLCFVLFFVCLFCLFVFGCCCLFVFLSFPVALSVLSLFSLLAHYSELFSRKSFNVFHWEIGFWYGSCLAARRW